MNRLDSIIRARLWPENEPSSRALLFTLTVARHIYGIVRELAAGDISLRAMGLVYTTMLAVVPLLAFSFSIAKGLGLHRQLEPMLREFLAPIGPRSDEISTNVIGFVDNVSGSVLAVLSIGLLLVTALSMAQKVESAFNFVWRVDRPRGIARRIGDYLGVILLGPIAMIVATTAIAAISNAALIRRMGEVLPGAAWLPGINQLAPYVLVIFAFAVLYMLVPNTRVRIVPALIGAATGGIAWVSAGKLFTLTIVSSTRLEAIYSGFAIVIVLMIWLHLSWLILLLGSQLAYYVQHPYQLALPRRAAEIDARLREQLAFAIMLIVGRDFENPGHGWGEEGLAAELRVPRSSISSVLEDLVEARLVVTSESRRLMPARDPRRISLGTILAAVRGRSAAEDDTPEALEPIVEALAGEIDTALTNAMAGRTLADLLDIDMATETAAQTPARPVTVAATDAGTDTGTGTDTGAGTSTGAGTGTGTDTDTR